MMDEKDRTVKDQRDSQYTMSDSPHPRPGQKGRGGLWDFCWSSSKSQYVSVGSPSESREPALVAVKGLRCALHPSRPLGGQRQAFAWVKCPSGQGSEGRRLAISGPGESL